MAPPTFPSSLRFFNLTFPSEYVAHVEINRPEKLNAFVHQMWFELKALFEWLSPNPDVRCIIFSGAGKRAFTTGLDVQEASSAKTTSVIQRVDFPDPSRKAFALRQYILDLQSCVSAIADCQKPVIALIHGYCYGLGIDLATACDVRFCAADTRFCVKEVDIGLAADVGTLTRLPKVLGGVSSWAKEVCLSARVFDAHEAARVGFVSRVVEAGEGGGGGIASERDKDKEDHHHHHHHHQQSLPLLLQEGLRLAQTIASKSPVAVQGTKNILDAAWGRTVADSLTYTAVWNAAMLQSQDVSAAMLSGLQRKTPLFAKL